MNDYKILNNNKLREINPRDFDKRLTNRLKLSSITLPSQYASYATCVEFAKQWFLEKYPHHFFNSIYVEGSHSFDEFRKFSDIDDKLRRHNPLLAIIPTIDLSKNRDWIDSKPEAPLMLRRTRMEGTFFNDIRDNRGLHLQLQFKTISMNFTFKIRLDTRAEELDMMEFIKLKHRAGWTETRKLDLDIHVPKQIISQIAWDNDIKMYDDGTPIDSIAMLKYLNSHSVIPFLYKLRCATGNNEYFIKVPNCAAYIRTEIPNMDDGERADAITTNYNIDFNIEIEMTAPYCYTYYSQREQNYIKNFVIPDKNKYYICCMQSAKTEIPPEDEHHWAMLTQQPIQYQIDDEDIGTEIDIDFKDQFNGTELGQIIQHTLDLALNPYLFINFKIFNDSIQCEYEMDWKTLIMHVKRPATNSNTLIAIYIDNEYVMNTITYLNELDTNTSRIK